MKKKFKLKKLSKHMEEAQIEKDIVNWIDAQLCDKYFDYDTGCYVDEIQRNVEIEINIKITP